MKKILIAHNSQNGNSKKLSEEISESLKQDFEVNIKRIDDIDQELKKRFAKVLVETNSNTPFLAGQLQVGSFEFLLIAPATSNTVAKIAVGIADSLLTNSAAMALKGGIPVYVMPSDYEEGKMITKLPDGRDAEVRVRRKDVENVETLRSMDSLSVLENLEEIHKVFSKHFEFKE